MWPDWVSNDCKHDERYVITSKTYLPSALVNQIMHKKPPINTSAVFCGSEPHKTAEELMDGYISSSKSSAPYLCQSKHLLLVNDVLDNHLTHVDYYGSC